MSINRRNLGPQVGSMSSLFLTYVGEDKQMNGTSGTVGSVFSLFLDTRGLTT
jgi:hypothetical protein